MREEKNATLKPDVLALLAEQAETEGKTVDDLLDEAARKLIETRRSVTVCVRWSPRIAHKPSKTAGRSGALPPSLRNTAKKNALGSAVGHPRYQSVRVCPNLGRQTAATPRNGPRR